MDIIPFKVQIISIISVLIFMYVVVRLIIRGKLREEYSIVWILGTFLLIVFSIWRQGLQRIAGMLNVTYAPSLLFLIAIFAIICFLLHLSVVISKLQSQIKDLAYELAILKQESSLKQPAGGEHRNAQAAKPTDPQQRSNQNPVSQPVLPANPTL